MFSITTNNFYQMAKYIKKNGKTDDLYLMEIW